MQIGCGLLGAGLTLLTACDAELYHELDEHSVNESLLSLRQAGLAADKKPSGRSSRGAVYTLVVPKREEDHALSVLRELGLPTVAPVRDSGKLALLPGEVKAAQLRERELTLADTLMSLPQVRSARVHLAFAEADPLLPTAQLRPTASVLLRLRGNVGEGDRHRRAGGARRGRPGCRRCHGADDPRAEPGAARAKARCGLVCAGPARLCVRAASGRGGDARPFTASPQSA